MAVDAIAHRLTDLRSGIVGFLSSRLLRALVCGLVLCVGAVAHARLVRKLTEGNESGVGRPAMDDAGAFVWANRSGNELGTNHVNLATDDTGELAVFGGDGDWIDENRDYDRELHVADQSIPPRIVPSAAAPTVVTWDAEPKYIRYDVIRGDVSNLAANVPGTIDLGPVVCLEDDSPDNHTRGHEDPDQPVAGQVFFYLYRGSQGLDDTDTTWGFGSSGDERVAGAGACDLP